MVVYPGDVEKNAVSARALHLQSAALLSSTSLRVRESLGNLRGVLEYGYLSLMFQLPNLPLFTLKVVLLLPCIGSLYRTYVYRDGMYSAPSGILSLEGKECLVLT